MSVDRTEVARIASLARLRFGEDEVERLTAELNGILEHVEVLRSLSGVVREDLHDERSGEEPAEQRRRALPPGACTVGGGGASGRVGLGARGDRPALAGRLLRRAPAPGRPRRGEWGVSASFRAA